MTQRALVFEGLPAALSGASAAANLALLVDEDCGHDTHHYGGFDDDHLSVVLHPLRFRVAGDIYIGCVLGNLSVALLFFCVHCLTRRCLRPLILLRGGDPVLVEAKLAQPAMFFVVMIFLQQGSAYASGHLLFRSADALQLLRLLVGVVGCLAFCISAPVFTWLTVLRHLHLKMIWEEDDEGCVRNWFLGPGEWCSQAERWHERYAMCIWQYRPPHMAKAVVVQYVETTALALIAAIEKHDYAQCAWAQAGYAAVMLLHGAWIMCYGPYARSRDSVWEFASSALVVTAMSARILAYARLVQSPSALFFDAASALLFVTVVILGLKLFLDFACWVYVTSWGPIGIWHHIGRREILQARVELRAMSTAELEGEPWQRRAPKRVSFEGVDGRHTPSAVRPARPAKSAAPAPKRFVLPAASTPGTEPLMLHTADAAEFRPAPSASRVGRGSSASRGAALALHRGHDYRPVTPPTGSLELRSLTADSQHSGPRAAHGQARGAAAHGPERRPRPASLIVGRGRHRAQDQPQAGPWRACTPPPAPRPSSSDEDAPAD